MKILMLSWRGPGHPNSGGAEIVTHQHAKAWADAGHNVTLFTSWFPGVPRVEEIDGVKVIRGGQQLVMVQIAAFFWYLFANHPKFDLVVDQFHGIPFFTPLFTKGQKLAFIHEVAKEVWWNNHLDFPINYIYGLIGYVFEPMIFGLYRRTPFLTVSESTKSDLVKWGIPASNITVIENGVSTRSTKAARSSQPTAIYLGAVARDKGIEDALETFSLLRQSNLQWQLWVVGKAEPGYMTRLKVGPGVKFWGFVTESKKFELLAKAWVMLNPSHREGWGLVNIEANSVGTPVVAYNVSGCRDSVIDGETGYLCKFRDIDCLAKTVIKLVKDQSAYGRISSVARKWAKNFTWQKSTQASLRLIEQLSV